LPRCFLVDTIVTPRPAALLHLMIAPDWQHWLILLLGCNTQSSGLMSDMTSNISGTLYPGCRLDPWKRTGHASPTRSSHIVIRASALLVWGATLEP
jgi:hypothetical protein